MKRVLKLAPLVLGVVGMSCWADMIDRDPLRGYCAGDDRCVDNGASTRTKIPPIHFGFAISPEPETGDRFLDRRDPDDDDDAHAPLNSGGIFQDPLPPAVPEPSSIILLGSVLLGVVTLLKRRAQRRNP